MPDKETTSFSEYKRYTALDTRESVSIASAISSMCEEFFASKHFCNTAPRPRIKSA